MRLYALNKRQFVMVFAAFFMCFALSVFIGIAGKVIVLYSDNFFKGCNLFTKREAIIDCIV